MFGGEPRIRAGNGSPSEITAMDTEGRGRINRGVSILQSLRAPWTKDSPWGERGY